MTLKALPNYACDPENIPESGGKLTNVRKGSRTEILMWLSDQPSELLNIFKEASRNFRWSYSTGLILKAFIKINRMTQSLIIAVPNRHHKALRSCTSKRR